MIDPISITAGAAAIVVGYFAGHFSSQAKTSQPTGLLCSCGHGYGTHNGGRDCKAKVERPHYWSTGERYGYEWVPCPCLSYDGPEPLPRVWTDAS